MTRNVLIPGLLLNCWQQLTSSNAVLFASDVWAYVTKI